MTNNHAIQLVLLKLHVPRMVFYVLNFVALLRVDLHDMLHQVFGLFVDVARYQILARENLLVEFVSVRVFKGQVTDCHCIQDHSKGPNICVKSMVPLASDHFRRGITWTSTGGFQSVLFRLVGIAEAEVDNLNVHVLVQKKVLRLQVTMTHFDFV